jgi:hypothetical protein
VVVVVVVEDLAAFELVAGELDPPTSNMTRAAVTPLGMVTTQKLAPPAPVDESELVTSFTLFTDGSMEQGMPLHPEHSNLIPQLGRVFAKFDAV